MVLREEQLGKSTTHRQTDPLVLPGQSRTIWVKLMLCQDMLCLSSSFIQLRNTCLAWEVLKADYKVLCDLPSKLSFNVKGSGSLCWPQALEDLSLPLLHLCLSIGDDKSLGPSWCAESESMHSPTPLDNVLDIQELIIPRPNSPENGVLKLAPTGSQKPIVKLSKIW